MNDSPPDSAAPPPKIFVPPPMTDAFAAIARSGEYREYLDALPPACAPDQLDAVKDEILAHLAGTPILALATMSPEGWPQMHEMHFSTMRDVGKRPVVYSFTHPNTRKVINLPHDARMAFSCYKTISFERRRETRAFYARGLARMVDSAEEWALAEEAHWTKEGQEYAKLLRVEKQPLIRMDILQGVWFNPTRRPRHCLVDYFNSDTASSR
ncbi:MAG: hypothetical protein QM696_14290 [Steroidobacteraceae bacterium]